MDLRNSADRCLRAGRRPGDSGTRWTGGESPAASGAPPADDESPSGGRSPVPACLADFFRVEAFLGRPPMGAFDVVVRDAAGDPVVIRNAPLLDDGTPMPTRYWLVDTDLRRRVDHLEAAGGVRRAEADVPAALVADAHRRAAVERDAVIPEGWEGPRPSGGVGGTRRGVKCLHAHLAWHLAGGDDPVGRWTADHLARSGGAPADMRSDQAPTGRE